MKKLLILLITTLALSCSTASQFSAESDNMRKARIATQEFIDARDKQADEDSKKKGHFLTVILVISLIGIAGAITLLIKKDKTHEKDT